MKGLILAAGRGLRMVSITNGRYPKELLSYRGRPVLSYGLELLCSLGVDDIAIVSSREKVRFFEDFVNANCSDARVSIVVQPSPLRGTAHAVASASRFLASEGCFAVVCGDTVFEGFERCRPFSSFDSTTVFTSRLPFNTGIFGVVCSRKEKSKETGRVLSVTEKPDTEDLKFLGKMGPLSVSCGIYLIDRKVLRWVRESLAAPSGEVYLTESLQLALLSGHGVSSYPFPGTWVDLGTPEAYEGEDQSPLPGIDEAAEGANAQSVMNLKERT